MATMKQARELVRMLPVRSGDREAHKILQQLHRDIKAELDRQARPTRRRTR